VKGVIPKPKPGTANAWAATTVNSIRPRYTKSGSDQPSWDGEVCNRRWRGTKKQPTDSPGWLEVARAERNDEEPERPVSPHGVAGVGWSHSSWEGPNPPGAKGICCKRANINSGSAVWPQANCGIQEAEEMWAERVFDSGVCRRAGCGKTARPVRRGGGQVGVTAACSSLLYCSSVVRFFWFFFCQQVLHRVWRSTPKGNHFPKTGLNSLCMVYNSFEDPPIQNCISLASAISVRFYFNNSFVFAPCRSRASTL